MKYFSNSGLGEQLGPFPNFHLTLDALREGHDEWGRGGEFSAKAQGKDEIHSGQRAKESTEDRNPKFKGKLAKIVDPKIWKKKFCKKRKMNFQP